MRRTFAVIVSLWISCAGIAEATSVIVDPCFQYKLLRVSPDDEDSVRLALIGILSKENWNCEVISSNQVSCDRTVDGGPIEEWKSDAICEVRAKSLYRIYYTTRTEGSDTSSYGARDVHIVPPLSDTFEGLNYKNK